MTGTLELKTSRETDKALIRRFLRHDDGEAFSILVRRYADMVYTTTWRVLRDEALAADAVQETFFDLVKNADRITGSLGSWLHRVATRRAVDLIRQNVSRRAREDKYATEATGSDNSWSALEPAVDEALEQLPEDSRDILLLHYLQGQSTLQIAAAKGVSQPTVSRRLSGALELLREKLRANGIMAGVVPLQAFLLHSNVAAPEALRISLGKIALAKAAGVHSFWIIAKSLPVKIAAATAAIVVATTPVWLSRTATIKDKASTEKPSAAPVASPSLAEKQTRPNDAAFVQTVTNNSDPQLPKPAFQNARVIPVPVPKPRREPPPSQSPPATAPIPPPTVPLAGGANQTSPFNNGGKLLPIQNWTPTVPVDDNRFLGSQPALNGAFYRPPINRLEKAALNSNNVPGQTIAPIQPRPRGSGSAFAPAQNPGQNPRNGTRRNSRIN